MSPQRGFGKIIFLGCVWFFVTLLPVSGIYPIFNIRADRYMYLPSMGLCLAVSLVLSSIGAFADRRGARGIRIGVILFLVLMSLLCLVTMERSTVWKDNFVLWKDAVAKAPGIARAHTVLGNAYIEKKDYSRSRREYETAIALDPHFIDAHNDLGVLCCETGDYAGAISEFQKAIDIYPRHPEAYYNLAYTYKEMGRWEEAIRGFAQARERNPGLAEAYLQLGLIHEDRGEEDLARRECERARFKS